MNYNKIIFNSEGVKSYKELNMKGKKLAEAFNINTTMIFH